MLEKIFFRHKCTFNPQTQKTPFSNNPQLSLSRVLLWRMNNPQFIQPIKKKERKGTIRSLTISSSILGCPLLARAYSSILLVLSLLVIHHGAPRTQTDWWIGWNFWVICRNANEHVPTTRPKVAARFEKEKALYCPRTAVSYHYGKKKWKIDQKMFFMQK